MNNKLLTWVLILGIASTGFAALSSADDSGENKMRGNSEIRELFQKAKSGETLTVAEQTQVDEAKAEKEVKKAERQANRELKSGLITALVNGDTLTAEQTELRVEMLEKINSGDDERKSSRPGKEIISKLLQGTELTDEESVELAEMQEKKLERQAAKEAIAPIMEKKKSGEDLTEAEQAQLDEFKANHKGKKKGGHRKGSRGEK